MEYVHYDCNVCCNDEGFSLQLLLTELGPSYNAKQYALSVIEMTKGLVFESIRWSRRGLCEDTRGARMQSHTLSYGYGSCRRFFSAARG